MLNIHRSVSWIFKCIYRQDGCIGYIHLEIGLMCVQLSGRLCLVHIFGQLHCTFGHLAVAAIELSNAACAVMFRLLLIFRWLRDGLKGMLKMRLLYRMHVQCSVCSYVLSCTYVSVAQASTLACGM